MTVRKVGRMWSSGVGEFMSTTLGRVIQIALVLLGIAGLVLLGFRRRWWETLCLAAPIVLVTVVGAASLAAPRRNEILMTLIFPLAGLALATARRGPILRPEMVPLAGIFPAELTALRGVGLAIALILIVYAVARRRTLRNADVLLLLLSGIALAIVTGTEVVNGLLSAFSFEKGNGGRILGLAVFAIFILFLITLRALSVGARNSRQLSAALEGLAWEEFRQAGLPDRFKGKVAILVPAYNEAENIGVVLDQMPAEVCGVRTEVLVVDDGSRDGTGDVAAEHGALVARHVTNRGGGAALRTGYRLMVESGAEIVVTLDADGQHLPSEMPRLVEPVLSGEVDVAHGSRVLGHADRNTRARELGIVFFNRLVSFITRTHVTDCSNGYRAVRTTVLPQLVLRQEQFHTSEFMIEAIKRGVPAKEVADHGRSAPPRALEEARGVPLRRRLRQRDRPHLAALSRRH